MFAAGEREFAGYAEGYRASFGSTDLSALTTALGRLAEATDGMADAVTRRDRLALARSNEQAEALVDDVNRLAAALTDEDRALLGPAGIPALCERLSTAARRNAYLIEHAWAPRPPCPGPQQRAGGGPGRRRNPPARSLSRGGPGVARPSRHPGPVRATPGP